MKYWTLFTLRMMARVGLLGTLLIWAVGGSKSHEWSKDIGKMHSFVEVTESGLECQLFRGGVILARAVESKVMAQHPGPVFEIIRRPSCKPTCEPFLKASVLVLWLRFGHVGVIAPHWLLCLAFLITVIFTWPRKKQTPQQESEQ